MANSSHIVLAVILGLFSHVLGTPSSVQIIKEISRQVFLTGGKVVNDCDAILVSAPGKISLNPVPGTEL